MEIKIAIALACCLAVSYTSVMEFQIVDNGSVAEEDLALQEDALRRLFNEYSAHGGSILGKTGANSIDMTVKTVERQGRKTIVWRSGNARAYVNQSSGYIERFALDFEGLEQALKKSRANPNEQSNLSLLEGQKIAEDFLDIVAGEGQVDNFVCENPRLRGTDFFFYFKAKEPEDIRDSRFAAISVHSELGLVYLYIGMMKKPPTEAYQPAVTKQDAEKTITQYIETHDLGYNLVRIARSKRSIDGNERWIWYGFVRPASDPDGLVAARVNVDCETGEVYTFLLP